MKSYSLIILACLFLIGLCNLRTCEANVPDYDSFVFAIQWGNNICSKSDSACNSKLSRVEKNTMTIHGLWPSLASGVRLPDCNTGATIKVQQSGLSNYGTLLQIWPSLTSNPEFSFWSHEYNKHGYCYVIKQGKTNYSVYFEKVAEVFANKNYKKLFQNAFGGRTGSYSYSDMFNKISGALGHRNFKMLCRKIDGEQRITEVYISLNLSFDPMPAQMGVSCPTTGNIAVNFK